jgi:hypothetical protein
MNNHLTEKLTFVTGTLRSKDIGYVIARDKTLDPIESPQSSILVWHEGDWLEGGTIPWNCVAAAMLSHPPQLLMAGPFGEVLAMGSGDVHKERISDGTNSPRAKAMIRSVRCIDNHIYAVGMQRQVYKRFDRSKWQWIGPDAKIPDGGVRGFESIDGFNDRDLYVVGWEGEIWHYNGQNWTQNDSPTNLVLNAVLCIKGGRLAYACGQCGILLRWQMGKWEVVDHQASTLDFWDMAWFDGKLYISTMESLLCFDGETMEIIDFGIDHPGSCYHLSSIDGNLLSIGTNDIMVFDGNDWRRIG